MHRRRLGRLRGPRQCLLDSVELGLADIREQRDLAAAARLALERPVAERRPVHSPSSPAPLVRAGSAAGANRLNCNAVPVDRQDHRIAIGDDAG